MPMADYKISWREEIPDYVARYQYPRRWSAARGAVVELANGRAGVLVIGLEDKRASDLCKSAIYSESSKIRERDPTFRTIVTTHQTDSGRYELYVEKEGS